MREELCLFSFSLFVLLVVMKFFEVLKNLFFVPKCLSCDERLLPVIEGNGRGKLCFCDDCLKKWDQARGNICPACSEIAATCSCLPKFFKDNQPSVPSVCFYNPKSNDIQTRAILKMKRINNSHYFEFMAEELYPSLENLFFETGIKPAECLFTWIPRKRASISKHGFDQGRELAKKVAKMFGASVKPVFFRFAGEEQKTLSKKERKENAEDSIFLLGSGIGRKRRRTRKSFAKGKTFVIIDDVLTSGATLKRGVELLKSAGAEVAVVACIARTEVKAKK